MNFSRLSLAGLLLLLPLPATAADIILNWNTWMREAIRRNSSRSNPGYATRAFAMINGAMYDARQAIARTHQPFHVDTTVAPTTHITAACSQAAFKVAVQLYPAEADYLNWANGATQAQIPASAAKDAGIALGDQISAAYLSWRANDGSANTVPYTPGTLPGQWRPDPLFFPAQTAWGPEWGVLQTFVLTSPTQFQPPPVPALTSAEYTAAFNEVAQYGAKNSTVRTADQTQVGLFWAYDRSGLGPPPVLFNLNLHEIATQRGNSEAHNARLFTLASVAMADTVISGWKSKFTANFWRPTSAIREADTDGNPATIAQPNWEPLGCPGGGIFPDFTPPFPAYISGHASMGQACFTVLQHFYGMDDFTFRLTSAEVPGVTRHYTRFSQAAQENADSRIWLGVHWRFDQTEGQKLGADIARYIAARKFLPVVETFSDFCNIHGLTGTVHDDMDHDGTSDFAEYAFGTHPRITDQPPMAKKEMIGGVPCLAIHYTRRSARDAAGLQINAQISPDLQSWEETGFVDDLDPAGPQTEEVQSRMAWLPITGGGKLYMRLWSQVP